ncbi:MAG: hypothetical protein KJ043_20255, partial [Anaerolineae bacterium]|nr:hypothetical protein [Anaerolineae bacterium]
MTDLFAEIFPIEQTAIPFITAYQVKMPNGDFLRLANRLASRFRKQFGGIWLYQAPNLLTDTSPSLAELNIALDMLRAESDEWMGIESL